MCPPRELLNKRSNLWRPWEKVKIEASQGAPSQIQIPRGVPSALKCTICFRSYKRDSELRRHRISKHLRRREKCRYCEKEFTRKDNLTRHIKLAHINEDKPRCRFCKKPLSRRDAVQRHESRCPKNSSAKLVDVEKLLVPKAEVSNSETYPTHIERLRLKYSKLNETMSDEESEGRN